MSTKFNYKIDNLIQETVKAVYYEREGKYIDALTPIRKASEALCRAILYHELGETLGDEVVNGYKKINGSAVNSNTRGKTPLLDALSKMILNANYITPTVFERLKDIRYGGNSASHDPTTPKNEAMPEDASHCLSQLRLLCGWFFKSYLSTSIPIKLENAFKGEIDDEVNIEFEKAAWEYLYNRCDQFEKQNRYILISPPEYPISDILQLAMIYRIPWSLILDFDTNSKETGLHRASSHIKHDRILKAITIDTDLDQRDIIESSVSINFCFAKGISTSPSTIAIDRVDWRTRLKYPQFIRKLVSKIVRQSLKRTYVLFLYTELDFIRSIFDVMIEIIDSKSLSILFLTEDSSMATTLTEEFEPFGAEIIQIRFSDMLSGISSTILDSGTFMQSELYLLPVRRDGESNRKENIGKEKILTYIDRGIEVLYKDIHLNSELREDEDSFYKGNIITWKEIADDFAVRRNKTDDLRKMVSAYLGSAKGAYALDLFHKPGAGGTTLARSIAFELSNTYPTILIHEFKKTETTNSLYEISEFSQLPILAIVEGSKVSDGQMQTIINRVNRDKKHVVFVKVQRTFSLRGDTDSKTVFVSNHMADIDERNRFIAKYERIASTEKQKKRVRELMNRELSKTEVFDFPFTIFENDYFEESLDRYLIGYLEKLPQNQLDFTIFSSMVYFYSQNSLSATLFRNIFRESLSKELNLVSSEQRFIMKLLIQDFDYTQGEYTESWRPRFERFAKSILKLGLVGLNWKTKDNWKDNIASWAKKFIEVCGSSFHPGEETWDLLELMQRLLLDRDYEDLLGKNEEYSYVSTEKFSRLIRDIGDSKLQKIVFNSLISVFPNEGHFRGHYGRFLYETALDEADFQEAEEQIEIALADNENDFNLWHLMGMCNRRRVEFLIRNYRSQNYSEEETIEYEDVIKGISTESSENFRSSRKINPKNLHSHTAEIQLLLKVIDFGQSISSMEDSIDFLSNPDNKWYEQQLNQAFRLINDAYFTIEISRDIEDTKNIYRSKDMIQESEGKAFKLIGNYHRAITRFKNLAENAERGIRPYFRRMIVYTTLASKTKHKRERGLGAGWNNLSPQELKFLISTLKRNMDDEPENPQNARLWFNAARSSYSTVKIEDAISVLSHWKLNTPPNTVARLEADFYLYVLYTCDAIRKHAANSFLGIINSVEQARVILHEIRENRHHNDRYSFEWYGRGSDLKGLIPHSSLGRRDSHTGFFRGYDKLKLVTGVISNVYNNRRGIITLDCGLDAFFVPATGGFEARHETEIVQFYLSFRHSELQAWEVRKVGDERLPNQPTNDSTIVESEDFDAKYEDELIETVQIHENSVAQVEETAPENITTDKSGKNNSQLPGLKVIGKIDLSKFKKKKI